MASVLATISEMVIMFSASLKVIFDVVTAYHFEHNFQVRKGDKERLPELVIFAKGSIITLENVRLYKNERP